MPQGHAGLSGHGKANMDFRLVDAKSIGWSSWYRGQPTARLPGGGRVQVQTPVTPCRVTVAQPGMYRVEMALRPDAPAHAAFAEWVGEVEDSVREAASGSPELSTWLGTKSRSSTVFNNTMRLMAFSDTMAFDQTGAISANLMDATTCACLLELTGCWSTDARWGLRWKIVQAKFDVAPVAAAPAPLFVSESYTPAAFGFVDDV